MGVLKIGKISFMQINILPFGITREIVGEVTVNLSEEDKITVGRFRNTLFQRYPALERLQSLAIAINGEYAADDQIIQPGDEVVLIPPVSGG